MQEQIFNHTFSNGLTLVAQPMPWLESAAFSISVPAGCRFDPAEKIGTANFACEMVQRGCGPFSSREFIEALESLGVDYNSSASLYNTNFGGAMQAAQLHEALAIYADVLRRPRFTEDQLEDGRLVCYQEIAALGDDLAQRALQQLRTVFYGATDGRNCEGTMESVASITLDDIKQFHETHYRPNGLIIACAGKLDWETLKSHVGQLFDDWKSKPIPDLESEPATHGVHHIEHESEQTHIAVAFPGVAYSHDDYYLNRGAIGVLSGGMSSRLFTEVREKRGLCYSVFASCNTLLDRGAVLCYAGTTNERAQETLDVMVEELKKLAGGIHEDELRRLKVQIRSGMVMQQESCRGRAGSIAGDWFHLGRVRTLDEITEIINGLTVESINEYLAANPPGNFDVVTLGPQPLEFHENGIVGHGV
jgi:predicted Zn-dependent peptidase